MLLIAQPAGAAFDVNASEDAVDVSPGDGLCDSDPAPSTARCTLRAAIQEANALAGADAINVPAGTYALAIAGRKEAQAATGDLDLAGELEIVGSGARATVVNGSQLDRVFDVLAGAAVEVSGLTITGGRSHDPDATFEDDAVADGNGGGIRNAGTLTVVDSAVRANTARPTVDVVGSDEVLRATTRGGGIHTTGDLHLLRSEVSRNAATIGSGGGVWTGGGAVSVENSTVSGNAVGETGPGGGGGDGGGIYAAAGSLSLTNATIAQNSAADEGSPSFFKGASVALESGVIATAKNSILSAYGGATDGCKDAGSEFVSAGNNVAPGTTCGLTTAADRNLNPQLGPLADNGGPTDTHALHVGSPAIDFADPVACSSTDQRGVARPMGAGCDSGAYEAPCGNCGSVVVDPEPPPGPKADGTLTLDANKGKVDKGRKVTLSGQLDVAANESCEPARQIQVQRRLKSEDDSKLATFQIVQTDATGNYSLKLKVKKTYFYRAVVVETEACDDETSSSVKVRVQKQQAAQEA